jgi:hypothetical protein
MVSDFEAKRPAPQGSMFAYDRKHLEPKARRLLHSYLDAALAQKARYREAVSHAAQRCRTEADPSELVSNSSAATANAAARIVLEIDTECAIKELRLGLADPTLGFVADTYAAVAMGFRCVAGAYAGDDALENLGAAAAKMIVIAQRAIRPPTV